MHDRDVAEFFQLGLDLEALGRLDVLEVDATEGGGQRLHHLHEFDLVLLFHAQVDRVNVGELLEENCFALHNGLGG